MRTRPIAIAFLCLALPRLAAAGGEIPFDILADVESQAITFLRDSDGFIWIGTLADGLYRFDGKELKHYTSSSRLISGSNIPAMEEDGFGDLWFATSGAGVSRYDKNANEVTRYLQPGQGLNENTIFWGGKNAMAWDPAGTMWVGTMGGGVFGIDPSTGNMRRLAHDPGNPQSLPNDFIRAVYVDSRGRLWIGSEEGLSLFDNGVFTHYRPGNEPGKGMSGLIVMAILEDSSGFLWVGTESGGLNRIDPGTGRIDSYTHDNDDPASIGSNRVTYLYEDSRGRLWCSHESLISVLDADRESFTVLAEDITEYFEYAGEQWALFDSGKLGMYEENRPRFTTYTAESDAYRGFRTDIVVTIYEDSGGTLWISTLGGLYRFDRETGIFTVYLHEPDNPETLPSTVNYSPGIFEDSEHLFWIGNAMPGSLSLFDRKTGRVVKSYLHDPEDPSSIPDCGQVNMIIEDAADPGVFWIASAGGLIEFDKRSGRFTHHTRNDCWGIYQDRQGKIWVATWGKGLLRYNPDTGAASYYEHDPADLRSVSANITTVIHESADGTIWIGAENGLNTLDTETMTFTSYTERNGFPIQSVHSIGEDDSGILWLGTGNGLVRFDPRSREMVTYGSENGFKANMFYALNGIHGSDGKLWFGGVMGIVAFDPDEIVINPTPPQVALTSVRQGGLELDLPAAPERLSELTLDWRSNFFEFEFAVLNYRLPAKNQFAYKLEGVDQDWYVSGSMNFGRYSGLAPGEYTLRLKGSNNDGVWKESGRSLRITVPPPFWKSLWFLLIIAAICASAAVIVALYMYRLNREIRRRRATEKMLKEAGEETEKLNRDLKRLDTLKDEFLANTSHELRTPLHGIIGISESLIDGIAGDLNPQARSNLALIIASARRLTNLVNDILDFSKLKHRDIQLRVSPLDMYTVAEVVTTICRTLVGSKAIRIENEIPAGGCFVLGDPDRVQQVLYNLVSNAIKFTREGSVRISARKDGETIVTEVEDTGIGIPPEKRDRIFESFEQADGSIEREYGGTGLGLAVSRKIVELHGGSIGVRSTPDQGSCFHFSLPASSDGSLAGGRSALAVNRESPEAAAHPETRVVPAEPSTPLPARGHSGKTQKILIVDDEPVNLQLLCNQLELRDFEVTQVYNGEDALLAIERQPEEAPFGMVLLDIMMPRMSGYEVCRRIREKYPSDRLPVIMLTARNGVEDLVVGLRTGANDYITKPFSKEELFARIENQKEIFDLSRANREAMRLIEKSLTEKETLLREIHHRVKNNLALIISLLNLQSDQYRDDMRIKFIEIINRIHAISLVHEKLYETNDLSRIGIREYTEELIEDIRLSFDLDDIDIVYDMDPIDLSLTTMMPLGLIINELITNSMKYAKPREGILRIDISMKREPARIVFTYRDNGPGYPPGFDLHATQGLGMQVILSLGEQIGALPEILPPPGAGIRLSIDAAMAGLAGSADR